MTGCKLPRPCRTVKSITLTLVETAISARSTLLPTDGLQINKRCTDDVICQTCSDGSCFTKLSPPPFHVDWTIWHTRPTSVQLFCTWASSGLRAIGTEVKATCRWQQKMMMSSFRSACLGATRALFAVRRPTALPTVTRFMSTGWFEPTPNWCRGSVWEKAMSNGWVRLLDSRLEAQKAWSGPRGEGGGSTVSVLVAVEWAAGPGAWYALCDV